MPFADVNGTRLFYEDRGEGEKTLLFLHGFTLDHRMWKAQADALAREYRVVTYDARGFGQSALPVLGEPFRHCDDAAALIEHLGLGRAVLVGHSIGANQLLELAIVRPELVEAYVAINASGLAGIPFPEDIVKVFAEVKTLDTEDAKRVWGRCGWFTSAREIPEVSRAVDEMLAGFSGWQWKNANPVKNIEPPAGEQLGKVLVPALVITGARDLPYNTVVGDALTAGLPHATRLHLADVGHMAPMEAPEAVNLAITKLVS